MIEFKFNKEFFTVAGFYKEFPIFSDLNLLVLKDQIALVWFPFYLIILQLLQ